MYKNLEQQCKCGQKMVEVLGYVEKQDGDEHPKAFAKVGSARGAENGRTQYLEKNY